MGEFSQSPRLADRLSQVSLGLSLGLAAVLVYSFIATQSNLALAQAADSWVDIGTAIVLLWALRVARSPADEGHPLGHRPAEPIAGLIVALLAGITGAQVVRSAIESLLRGPDAQLPYWLALIFAGKLVAKASIALLAYRGLKRHGQPPLRALYVDARNDVLGGFVALVGYFTAADGYRSVDAWLAIPIGLWIAWSGFSLARENISLLMGGVVESAETEQLVAAVNAMENVARCIELQARYHGTSWDVDVRVLPHLGLSLRDMLALHRTVRSRLEEFPEVTRANVHVELPESVYSEAGG